MWLARKATRQANIRLVEEIQREDNQTDLKTKHDGERINLKPNWPE